MGKGSGATLNTLWRKDGIYILIDRISHQRDMACGIVMVIIDVVVMHNGFETLARETHYCLCREGFLQRRGRWLI